MGPLRRLPEERRRGGGGKGGFVEPEGGKRERERGRERQRAREGLRQREEKRGRVGIGGGREGDLYERAKKKRMEWREQKERIQCVEKETGEREIYERGKRENFVRYITEERERKREGKV